MNYIRFGENQKIHIRPLHTKRTLCGDERDVTKAIQCDGPATCEWCVQSLDDLKRGTG
jgi:hypothetical protein